MAARLLVAILTAASLSLGCNEMQDAGRGVVLLRYMPGSESTEQRERGFLDTLAKEFPHIKVISSDQYGGATAESALDKATDLLNKYRERVSGACAVTQLSGEGLLGALENVGESRRIKTVVFDPSAALISAVRDERLQGIVLQDPVGMGYLGVKTMIAHLKGETVEKRIVTDVKVATLENLNDSAIQKLLEPAQSHQGGEHSPSARFRIAVVPKGTTHEFWNAVHAGAAQAAHEEGDVELYWKGPLQENDIDGQINVVQEFITKKVDGLVLAPLDSQALVASVKDAQRSGVPTVIIDSGLADESAIVSYVATDNYQSGALAARRLAKALGTDAGSD
jgi:ABC-type sugar transport system substrate-binding protein